MKIYLDSVGCRLNQSEIERYARQFRAAGCALVADPHEADYIVLNTCTVTTQADADSRQKARSLARQTANEGRVIYLTGCWAPMAPQEAAALPGVRQVVPNSAKDFLVQAVLSQVHGQPRDSAAVNEADSAGHGVCGARQRTRSFIKVQDGCNNRCTFCVTTLARGASRSLPMDEVLDDVRDALAHGAQEIVLSGVHLASWGQDLPSVASMASASTPLYSLIEAVLTRTSVPRLRLSSLEPWDLDAPFFNLWSEPRLCRHLHLPLQSGCERTLRRMARRTSQRSFAHLVEAARKVSADIAITTDVITGFPGETDEEFRESLAFVRAMSFSAGHVFTYSERAGTPAARMPNPVPHSVRKARNAEMRALFNEASLHYRRRFVNTTASVLWEQASPLAHTWELNGLTDNYIRVYAPSPINLWNEFSQVSLVQVNEDGMAGELLCDRVNI